MTKAVSTDLHDLQTQFAYVDALINRHRTAAIATVNVESLLTAWEVGQYISIQLKSAQWGAKVVSDLADYLKRQNPKRGGFGKRHLYNMVKFYDTYSTDEFHRFGAQLNLDRFVQLPIAQIEETNASLERGCVKIRRALDFFYSEKGVSLTILRPTMIYGNINDRNVSVFMKMVYKLMVVVFAYYRKTGFP